jgi:c(7)-type cytochrome triheme protein
MRTLHTAVLAALALALATARAGELPRLPKALQLPPSGDSPGQVTFNHDSHVDAKKPSCTACHPRLFPMLEEGALKKGAITHEKMEKGQYCGACHGKGKAAFDFSDDNCQNCHAG